MAMPYPIIERPCTALRYPLQWLLCLSILLAGCATGDVASRYLFKASLTGTANSYLRAKDRIDREECYQVFFRIRKQEKCIKIALTTLISDRSILNRKIPVNGYFIVEKLIDIRKFHEGYNYTYSELGRNYDSGWKGKGEMTLCSSSRDPIRKLDPGIYRIRFTVFREEDFRFTFQFFTNAEQIAPYLQFPPP